MTWRGGATVTSDEEPILGYKVRYWESDQPIAKAHEVYKNLDGGDLEAVISGLIPGKVYKLRVLAYSYGGDGKMSSPAWEFKVGTGTHVGGVGRLTSAARSSHSIPISSFAAIIACFVAFSHLISFPDIVFSR